MANNAYFSSPGRKSIGWVLFSRPGVLVLTLCGLWAAGLAPLGAAPETKAPTPRVTGLSADSGRRITTVTIATSDPVAYLTNRPDPLTLLVELRDVDARGALSSVVGAKGVLAGASVEEATAPDGT